MSIPKYVYLMALALVLLAIFIYVNPRGAGEIIPRQSVAEDKTVVFSMRSRNLHVFPEQVFSMTQLEELDLSYNQLTGSLPAEIKDLKNLRKLNLSYNFMTGLPAELGQLSKLQELNVSYNELTGLPNELGNLSNLKVLNLTGNNYSVSDLKVITDKLPNLQVIK